MTVTSATTPRLDRAEWLADPTVALDERTVGGLLTDTAAAHPDRTALIARRHGEDGARSWTYVELLDEARAIAGTMLEVARPGDAVALWAPNVAEWPIVQYGAALAGVVLVAINPVFRHAELAYVLERSGANVLIHAERSRDYDTGRVARAVCAELGIEHRISLADRERLAGSPVELVDRAAPADPAMMQFTSGTTGHPKGVLLAHRSLVNNARLTLDAAEVEDGVVAVAPLPMFHTAACVISTLGPLSRAGTMVLVRDFDPAEVLRLSVEHRAGLLFSVPTVLGAVLEAARSSDGPLPQLRTVLVGGATVPGPMIEQVEQLLGAAVHNLFGQTELSPVLSLTRRTDSREELTTSVGRPLDGTDCRIVDPGSGEVQPLGVEGEVCARGYLQMIGYVGDREATEATVDAEGWVHTGDLGTMDERGMLRITGRLKDLIIRGGENIAPAEIEIALAAHPQVLEAAVFGVPDERWGEIVVAAIRTREPADAALERSLAEHCRERLSPFKLPQRWVFRDDLPHTASGKVQKFVLRDELLRG